MEVGRGQERLVAEHLLEVRDDPVGVDRVPVEAPAELVVDPARGHGVERGRHHGQGGLRGVVDVVVQEQVAQHRRGELGCVREAAAGIEAPGGVGDGPVEQRRRGVRSGRRGVAGRGRRPERIAVEDLHQAGGARFEVAAAVAPGVGDGLQHLDEAGPAPGGGRRKYVPP